MAGNSEETGAGAGWLAPLFEQLKAKLQQAADKLTEMEITDIAGVEKAARAAGVIARSAAAIDALRLRAAVNSEEDEMGERTYDPEEDERIRRELAVEFERIDAIIEAKRLVPDAGRGLEAGATQGEGSGPPDFS